MSLYFPRCPQRSWHRMDVRFDSVGGFFSLPVIAFSSPLDAFPGAAMGARRGGGLQGGLGWDKPLELPSCWKEHCPSTEGCTLQPHEVIFPLFSGILPFLPQENHCPLHTCARAASSPLILPMPPSLHSSIFVPPFVPPSFLTLSPTLSPHMLL